MVHPKVQVQKPATAHELHWDWPPEQDGWTKAHDAIRLDMKDFQKAIDALLRDTKPGESLPQWKYDALSNFFQRMHGFIVDHHNHEEQLIFPYMETRVQVPKKMSAQHEDLVKGINSVKDMVGRLEKEPNVVQMLQQIKTTFDTMAVEMREHLKEEEDIGLPLLRQNFTSDEMEENVSKVIVAKITLDEFAQFLRTMDDRDKRRWMTEVGNIPRLVQMLVMMPRTRKYNKTYILPLRDLIDNEKGKHAPAFFDCFGLLG